MLQLKLIRDDRGDPELEETCFERADGRRGKVTKARRGADTGCFYWRRGTQAITVFLLRWAAWGRRRVNDPQADPPHIQGHRGSLAASLNDALSKRTSWLSEMFGSDVDGNPKVDFIKRTNRDFKTLKRAPVKLCLDCNQLDPARIEVSLAGTRIEEPKVLDDLADQIVARHFPHEEIAISESSVNSSSPITDSRPDDEAIYLRRNNPDFKRFAEQPGVAPEGSLPVVAPLDESAASGGEVQCCAIADKESILTLFDDCSKDIIRTAIGNSDIPICACPSVAPRGFQKTGGQVFYHLGHFYFAELFNRIRAVHPKTALLLCPSRAYYKHCGRDFNRRMLEIGCTWMRCFSHVPEMHSIYRIIEHEEPDELFQALHAWLDKTGHTCHDELTDPQKEAIHKWRKGSILLHDNDLVSRLREIFGQRFQRGETTADQIMSVAYVLVKDPGWYDPAWFAKAVKGFASRASSVHKRFLGTDDIVIVEALKNRTTWESLAACAKAFCPDGKFPPRAYFKNVPNARGNGPMRSRDPGVIRIDDPVDHVLEEYDVPSLTPILEMFPQDVAEKELGTPSALRHSLSRILSRALKVLNLQCPLMKG
jgi:hypothetical protein